MHSIFGLIKKNTRLILVAVTLSVLSGILSTLLLRQIHLGIDEAQSFDLYWFTLTFFSLLISYFAISVFSSLSIGKVNREFIHSLRLELARKVLLTQYERIENIKSDLLPILTKDVNHISALIDRLPTVMTGLTTVIGILIYLFYLSPFMGFLTLLAFIILAISNHFNVKKVAHYAILNRAEDNKVFQKLEGLIYGISTLMMVPDFRNQYVDEGLKTTSEKQTSLYFKQTVYNAFNNRLNDFILLGFLGVLLFGVHQFQWVSIDFFSTYLTLILFILNPLSSVSNFFSTLKSIKASLLQFEKIGLELNKSLEDQTVGDDVLNLAKFNDRNGFTISLNNVLFTYRYVDEPFTLKEINTQFEEGKIYFIEGGNGSGKSTLIKLICGLYEPQSGTIKLNDHTITKAEYLSYRNLFGIILTDSYVFEEMPHLADEQIERATFFLKMTEMNQKISIDNKGKVSTKHLSAGQLKRLQMIQMMLEDKKVYIFDEWVAFQDSRSKQIFYEKILPYLKSKGKIIINIAHDYSYEHVADEIIRMEDGRIIDD